MVDKPIVIFSYIVLYLYSHFVICLYNYMSILNSNSLCINAFLLQRLPISVERVRWKVCSLFVFSVVSLLLSSWWWYFLFLVLPSLLNPFVLKFYSSGTKSRCLFFYVSMSRSCLISGHFFLCYVLASSCKLDFVYRCCSALFETSCEISSSDAFS